jgi:hypothetical protein
VAAVVVEDTGFSSTGFEAQAAASANAASEVSDLAIRVGNLMELRSLESLRKARIIKQRAPSGWPRHTGG